MDGTRGSTVNFGAATSSIHPREERGRGLAARYERFQAALELGAGEQNSMLALEAAQTDVRPEADDAPFVAAAGMGLPQADDILQTKFDDHALDGRKLSNRVAKLLGRVAGGAREIRSTRGID